MFRRTATRRVVVTRPAGLHARPCLAIATAVRQSRSKVEIRSNRQKVNAADVVELLSLGAGPGTELVLAAKGSDAEATLDTLVALFDNDFGLSETPA
jgi:phosphotransferase system HPr (HPr) family protein